MITESEILGLRSRITELENRLDFLYARLGIAYVTDQPAVDSRIMDALKQGNKIEAIKIYREIYNVGLAEAKRAVENMESKLL
jgi:ribosomal protein L7/L12